MGQFESLVRSVRRMLRGVGVELTSDIVRAALLVLLGIALFVLLRTLFRVVRALVSGSKQVVRFIRVQVERKFWRDSRILGTLVTSLLLIFAYAFQYQSQSRTPLEKGWALWESFSQDLMPAAIITESVLLLLLWLIFGRLAELSWGALMEPLSTVTVGPLLLMLPISGGSVAIYVVTAGDAEWSLVAAGLAFTVGGPIAAWSASRSQGVGTVRAPASTRPSKVDTGVPTVADRRAGSPGILRVLFLLVVLVAVLGVCIGGVVTAAYVYFSAAPSLPGLLAVNVTILAVVMLLMCFSLRFKIGGDNIPEAVGHFVDLSMAVSAAALTLTGSSIPDLVIDPIPWWALAVGPPLIVIAVIVHSNLWRLRQSTPSWRTCLIVALLAGPFLVLLKQLLNPAMQGLLGNWPFGP
jgi:hypothetical protein